MSEETLPEDQETESSQAKPAEPKNKRMSDEEWSDCKIKWASGQYTLVQLSELYGISVNGIHKRLKRAGIEKGQDSAAYEAEMRARQIEEAGDAAAERDAKIRAKALEAEEFMLNAVDVVSRRGLRAIVDAAKDERPIATALDDVKTCKEAIQMFKGAVETVQKIRGEDRLDDEELPELIVSGLTQEDMDEIRRGQEEEEALFGMTGSEDDLVALEE